jgi:hypothetical protein
LYKRYHTKNIFVLTFLGQTSLSSLSPKLESISISSSTVPYETLSNFTDNPSTIAPRPKSRTTSSYQGKYVSIDGATDGFTSSSSDSDIDDNDGKKKRERQEKK